MFWDEIKGSYRLLTPVFLAIDRQIVTHLSSFYSRVPNIFEIPIFIFDWAPTIKRRKVIWEVLQLLEEEEKWRAVLISTEEKSITTFPII